jgi:cytochrome P450
VFRETLRLRSPAPVLFLEALADMTVAGLELPRGTRVIGLSRYADAEAEPGFDPDRDANRVLAFGAGPRFCPGRNLALLEARSALAMLAGGFELALDPAAKPVSERFGFTMQPSELKVMLRER